MGDEDISSYAVDRLFSLAAHISLCLINSTLPSNPLANPSSQIYVYPLKSLRGLSPPTHTLTYRGPLNDRIFMFQRASDGANMAVARETEMCLFTTHLPASSSSSTSTDDLSEVEVRYALDHAFDKPDVKVDGSKPDRSAAAGGARAGGGRCSDARLADDGVRYGIYI